MDIVAIALLALAVVLVIGGGRELDRLVEAGVFAPEQAQELRARVTESVAGLAAFYTAGFWLLEIRRAPRNVGHGFVFVGAVLFGASLFLVGQMYNVEAHDALGFAVEARDTSERWPNADCSPRSSSTTTGTPSWTTS